MFVTAEVCQYMDCAFLRKRRVPVAKRNVEAALQTIAIANYMQIPDLIE